MSRGSLPSNSADGGLAEGGPGRGATGHVEREKQANHAMRMGKCSLSACSNID